MSLYIASLNSGSNGNCYYVGNDEEAVLVDAGLSCRETERRMEQCGLRMDRVKAIFISHEHTDHISGLPAVASKYNLPVFGTARTLSHGRLGLSPMQCNHTFCGDTITIGNLRITSFSKAHDAVDPISFTIDNGHICIGVFTDIGTPCAALAKHFSQCHAAFLEANYDAAMLDQGRYPYFLKQRIRGGKGHLSNAQALDVFRSHRAPYLSHILLAHLSKDNNCPELAKRTFDKEAKGVKVSVASRFHVSEVLHITGTPARPVVRALTLF